MKTIWDSLNKFYSDWLHPTFDSLMVFLTNNQYAIYILLGVVIVLAIVRRKIKIPVLSRVINFINTVIIILLIIVAYNVFSPALSKFFKTDTSTNSSTTTKTKPKATTGTESTPTQTTPSTQTTKQLYYGGGCSGCYADACPSNGYSYGGYDVNMYNYYKSLCQACQCTSSRWQSLWR